MSESNADIRGLLENILGEQITRLLASDHLKRKDVQTVTNALRESKLLPDQIEADLAQELQTICGLKYESANTSSNRLDGFGWSLYHLQEHMRKVMESKLSSVGIVLRTKLPIEKSSVPLFKESAAKHVEFLELRSTLEE